MGNKISLEDELVNLRITSKSMNRSSVKCRKNEKVALDKLKKVTDVWIFLNDHKYFYVDCYCSFYFILLRVFDIFRCGG